jgi:protease-4
MKQFFKFVFASMVGFFLTSLIIGGIVVLLIVGLVAAAGSEKQVEVEPNSIIHINFTNSIPERTPRKSPLDLLGLEENKTIGLNDILANIKRAKTRL